MLETKKRFIERRTRMGIASWVGTLAYNTVGFPPIGLSPDSSGLTSADPRTCADRNSISAGEPECRERDGGRRFRRLPQTSGRLAPARRARHHPFLVHARVRQG